LGSFKELEYQIPSRSLPNSSGSFVYPSRLRGYTAFWNYKRKEIQGKFLKTKNDKMNFTCSLHTPLALIRARETQRKNAIAKEGSIQYLKEHRARVNEAEVNRLAAKHSQLSQQNQATHTETKGLKESHVLTFQDEQLKLDSMVCRVSDLETRQKQYELKCKTLLAFNPVSLMSRAQKDEAARLILAYARPTEFEELEALQSLILDFPVETPKPSGYLYGLTNHVSYAVQCRRQEHKELDEEEAANNCLIAAATAAEIDESLWVLNEMPRPSSLFYGLTNPLSYSIQSGIQEQWELDLEKDAEETLAAATKTDEPLRYSVTVNGEVTKEPGDEPLQNKVKGMQWSFRKVCESLFLIHRL
jgi:hypothetical protein